MLMLRPFVYVLATAQVSGPNQLFIFQMQQLDLGHTWEEVLPFYTTDFEGLSGLGAWDVVS